MIRQTPTDRSLSGPENQHSRILILDDDLRYRLALRRKLSLHGFADTHLAATPSQALAISKEIRFDVVLLDLHLDNAAEPFSGLSCLAALRQIQLEALIVMVSGDESPDLFIKALTLGADDYWVKGAYLDIAGELQRLLGRGRRPPEGGWTPAEVTRLGYLRTLNLSPVEIDALRCAAARCGAPSGPLPINALFLQKRHIWRMFVSIFQRLPGAAPPG